MSFSSILNLIIHLRNQLIASYGSGYFLGIHLALLAVSAIFFGLYSVKEEFHEKNKKAMKYVKDEEIKTKLNKETNNVLLMLKRLGVGFRYLIFINVFCLLLVGVLGVAHSFEDIEWWYSSILLILVGLTLLSLWLLVAQIQRFNKVYLFDINLLISEKREEHYELKKLFKTGDLKLLQDFLVKRQSKPKKKIRNRCMEVFKKLRESMKFEL